MSGLAFQLPHHYFLPVEVEHRELDAKLLLTLKILARDKKAEVVIGYDKHITSILRERKDPSVLLDKSCSNIMFEARIRPVINTGGKVSVCDEEGINNITNNFQALSNRFDPRAVESIHKFFAWGDLDRKLAYKVGINTHKITIAGNPRIDLLRSPGRDFYLSKIESLQHIFGDFILINDNFVIEHFDPHYLPPIRSHLPMIEQKKMLEERNLKKLAASSERSSLVSAIKDLSVKHSAYNFIVRPHPMSDPSYWMNAFSKFRNVFVIYKESIEPWLFACRALVSCGCTTALQAALIKKPIYHFSSTDQGYSNSLSSNLGIAIGNNTQFDDEYPYSILDQNYSYVSQRIQCHYLNTL